MHPNAKPGPGEGPDSYLVTDQDSENHSQDTTSPELVAEELLERYGPGFCRRLAVALKLVVRGLR